MSVYDDTSDSTACPTPRTLNPSAASFPFHPAPPKPSPQFAHFTTPAIPTKSDPWYTYICFQLPSRPTTYSSDRAYDVADWNNYQKISVTVLNTACPLEIKAATTARSGAYTVQQAAPEKGHMMTTLTSSLLESARKFWNEYSEEMRRRLGLRVLLLDGLWPESEGKFTVKVMNIDAE
ncbi:hypothetical protein BJ508DRAFT_301884 [Ascobolus immersus RN42]|uniref:Uncharacterized protein n=1 Tax=Ascobolus immersus RN42 TaxID=1160509 RepID=A0A3N4IQM3_ASCIM|nr:hypothetical protein BJ508DRAFT_301884 [Ascobolus immersus RN42]